jgi:hypothetical protein
METVEAHPARPRTLLMRLAERDLAPVAVVALLWCGLLAFLPAEMSPDGWYAFLGGDVIVHHGLPSHDTLTVWGHGRRWVDQQWLAQLASYGLYALGGLRLALLANAAIVVGTFAAAVRLAGLRGGARRDVLYVSLPGAVALGLSSSAFRPQTLVLPLFLTLSWLLISDARSPSRRVFWTIPVLVLWANLHGSVTLGVLLVWLAVVCDAWTRRRFSARSVSLAVLAAASLFASPYAPHLLGYYHTVLFNGEFAMYLPDWMPTALRPATLAFYLLAFAAVFAIARAPRTLTAFEKTALVVLLVLAVEATRGVTWFTMFALVVLPATMRGWSLADVPPIRGRIAVVAAAAAIAAATIVVASRPSSWFAREYPTASARAAAQAAGNDRNVFANGAFGDWLLFKEPSLRGRMAYDARFEVLPDGRLHDAAVVSVGRYDTLRILRPFDVVVLRPQETELRDTLERTGNWRRVFDGKKVVVLRRGVD